VRRILVVLSVNKEGKWGLNKDKHYLYSAVTRASDLVHLLIIGYNKEILSLSDIVGIQGGVAVPMLPQIFNKFMKDPTEEKMRSMKFKDIW
jgi:hypothetical protein